MAKLAKVPRINWTTKKMKLSELKPWEPNPRKANKKERENLQISLDRFNLAEPLVANQDGTIIGGHFRYSILQEKGLEQEFDVSLPDRLLTQKELIELNLRLNKNKGEFDLDLLADLDEDLLKGVGFDDKEMKSMFQIEDYSDLEKELDSMDGLEPIDLLISIPKKHKEAVVKWILDGSTKTSAKALGEGLLKKCELL